MDDDENNITEWVEQRGKRPGRRDTDRNQCAMHDFMQNQNDHCFDIIKATIKEEVQRRDHKFEILENRLESFISKWALGMIVMVSITLLGGMFGFAVWQVKSLKENMDVFGVRMIELNMVAVKSLSDLNAKTTEIATRQEGIMNELEKLAPEHNLLMEHLRETRGTPK